MLLWGKPRVLEFFALLLAEAEEFLLFQLPMVEPFKQLGATCISDQHYFALDIQFSGRLSLNGPFALILSLLFALPHDVGVSIEVFFVPLARPQPLHVQRV